MSDQPARSRFRPPVLDRAEALRKQLDDERARGSLVGLVPTMGALHPGHESLVRRSAAECDVTAVTIFVNPLQFGPGEDLAAYPRPLERDLALAAGAGADVVFAPPAEEMFPDGRPATQVAPAPSLAGHLEGAHRPGHFAGVATVVAKLFNLVGPCRAYFGEKDFQQLAVIRRMAADLSFPVEVVACPTVRDGDGVAWSSRNAYLSAGARRAATVLVRALESGAGLVRGGERDAARVARSMEDVVAAEALARLDYAAVVDPRTLQPHGEIAVGAEVRLLVAARVGGTRLIDNLGVTAP